MVFASPAIAIAPAFLPLYARAQTPLITLPPATTTPSTLPEQAEAVAREWGISAQKLKNLIEYESHWNPKALGDHGKARGLVQIHSDFFPNVTEDQAYDPVFAMNFAAQAIKEGWEHKWTVCNCYSLVRSKLGEIPRMAQIQPNAPIQVGAVAIFYYTDKDTGATVKHIALIVALEETGFWVFESNFEGCKVGKRFIAYDDPHFAGTYFPG